jgi:hypothetical protein
LKPGTWQQRHPPWNLPAGPMDPRYRDMLHGFFHQIYLLLPTGQLLCSLLSSWGSSWFPLWFSGADTNKQHNSAGADEMISWARQRTGDGGDWRARKNAWNFGVDEGRSKVWRSADLSLPFPHLFIISIHRSVMISCAAVLFCSWEFTPRVVTSLVFKVKE